MRLETNLLVQLLCGHFRWTFAMHQHVEILVFKWLVIDRLSTIALTLLHRFTKRWTVLNFHAFISKKLKHKRSIRCQLNRLILYLKHCMLSNEQILQFDWQAILLKSSFKYEFRKSMVYSTLKLYVLGQIMYDFNGRRVDQARDRVNERIGNHHQKVSASYSDPSSGKSLIIILLFL